MGPATVRHLVLSSAVALLLGGVATFPAWAWGGADGLRALGLATGIAWFAAALAHGVAAGVASLQPGPEAGPRAVQVGIAVRLFLTLALALPVILLDLVPRVPFAAWLGLQYLGQLVLEVFVTVRESGQNLPPTGPAAGGSEQGSPPPPPLPPPGEADAARPLGADPT